VNNTSDEVVSRPSRVADILGNLKLEDEQNEEKARIRFAPKIPEKLRPDQEKLVCSVIACPAQRVY